MHKAWRVAAAGLLCMVASPVEARQSHRLELPPGNLQQAVIALGRQAGISIALTDPSLARVQVRRVSGTMTAEQALRLMLAGTPATFVALGGSAYRIVRAPVRKARQQRPSPATGSQPPDPADAAPIVVTATKRNIQLRDYPGPATVVTGQSFAAGSAAEGTAAISERVPSLGSTHLGPGRDKLFVRAVADSSFSGQTQSTVGQYFGEARLNYNAPDPDLRLYDVASIELLPGPQGTLYGAGSMGGVLRIVPNAPDPKGASAILTASAASTAHGDWSRELAGVVNLPLAERAAVRLVGYDIKDGGYIDDVGRGRKDVNRTDVRGGRAAAFLDLGEGWNLDAGGLVQAIDGRDGQYAQRSLPDLTRRTAIAQPFSNDYWLGHATVHGPVGRARLTATFSTAHQDLVETFDISGDASSQGLFRQRNRLSLQSAELRLSRTRADGSGWLVGAHLLRNGSRLDRSAGPPDGLAPLLGVRNRLDEQTLFGEYTRNLTPKLSVTAGARLTHVRFRGESAGSDEQVAAAGAGGGGSEWRFLPSVAAAIEPRDDLSLYLRYQQSFRPGGLIVRSEATQELASDRIAAWEAGLRFGQNRSARFSGALALSYARWTDVQADTLDTVGLPSTMNIGDGNIWTLDGRLSWRALENLTFSAAGTWNRSRVTNPDPGIIIVEDAPLPNVPDVSARIGFDYARYVPDLGDVQLSGWARYVGKSWLGIGPILGRSQGNFVDTGLEARLGRGRSFLFVRGTNLLDAVGNRFALGSVFTIVGEEQITPLRPRTVRIGFHTAF